MANNYNDTYAGIAKGEKVEAGKMTAALNQMEKVANKVTADEWEANKDDDVRYPTCKAVAGLQRDDVEFLKNKVNRILLPEARDDKYPSAKAVYDLLLTFFTPLTLTMNGNKYVRLTGGGHDFWIAKYETTQGEFENIMGYSLPRDFSSDGNPNLPAEYVTWYEALQYCLRLTLNSNDVPENVKEQIRGYSVNIAHSDTVKTEAYNDFAQIMTGCYRLPTEEEWKYACRGGMPTKFIWGDNWNASELDKYGWYYNNSSGRAHPVGQKAPNAYGLYDVLGNVWEWCSSVYYHAGYYETLRVVQGGSWSSASQYNGWIGDYYKDGNFASDYHVGTYATVLTHDLGFRVARTV
ncbi:sulfatase-modifying factor protein [Candidatus Termititenax persephonae]|uniref:Sulfatase-modifying factor protein n=1 Tax=Candidatus Termititenax persephonae TaxID=2218525 RepID=A0A388TKS4_9BACT|nr:sulfatase-modifying factor protein [Candidatus Termititenax persephonae]